MEKRRKQDILMRYSSIDPDDENDGHLIVKIASDVTYLICTTLITPIAIRISKLGISSNR